VVEVDESLEVDEVLELESELVTEGVEVDTDWLDCPQWSPP
jgi:hypothetical protein